MDTLIPTAADLAGDPEVIARAETVWPAVGVGLARAVGQEHRAMCAEPGGVAAARGEGPHAGDAIAAFAFDGAHPGARPPGQHRTWIVAEDLLRHRHGEIGCRHRAAAGLAQAPGGRGVCLGDGLDDMEEGDRIGLDAVGRARHQQAEQPRLVQLVQKGVWQAALFLDLVRGGLDDRPQRFGAGNDGGIACEVDGRRNERFQCFLFGDWSK